MVVLISRVVLFLCSDLREGVYSGQPMIFSEDARRDRPSETLII